MLLDRKRVKFWQRWVFLFMAILMGLFLIVGYSGVMGSCQRTRSSSGNAVQQEIDNFTAALKAKPDDPDALLGLGNAYVAKSSQDQGQNPDQQLTEAAGQDLRTAIDYYDRYLKLNNAHLGAGAKQKRIEAVLLEGAVFGRLGDKQGAAAAYSLLTQLDPKNPEYYLPAANAERDAGEYEKALLDYATYLKLAPNASEASMVRAEIKRLRAQLKAQDAVPQPTPSASK
jgi:tetratricopeptide (TPR) repeat protein